MPQFQTVQSQRNGDVPESFKKDVDLVKAHNAKEPTLKMSHNGPHAGKANAEYKELVRFKPNPLYGDFPAVDAHVHSGKPTGSLVSLPDQQLADHSKQNRGCSGGGHYSFIYDDPARLVSVGECGVGDHYHDDTTPIGEGMGD